MTKAQIISAIVAGFNKIAKWFYRTNHDKAANTIKENRKGLVQVKNPKSGEWKIIDRDKGEIIGISDIPLDGIEVKG